jgi:hypothetical protein
MTLVEFMILFADSGSKFFSGELIFGSSAFMRLLDDCVLNFVVGLIISGSFIYIATFLVDKGFTSPFCVLPSDSFIVTN